MDLTICPKPLAMIEPIREPKISYQAALYFMDGHYLFRRKEEHGWQTKFVTSADVCAAFSGKEQDSGWIQAGIVRVGSNASGEWYVYSTPPQKVTITLEGEAAITIPLPRLVMVGVGFGYFMFAIGSKHFDPAAKACYAPFPNVHDDGRICWGANTPGKAKPESARKAWDLFFGSPFNNHLVWKKSNAFEKDVREMLRSLAGKREYPANDMTQMRQPISYYVDLAIGAR